MGRLPALDDVKLRFTRYFSNKRLIADCYITGYEK